MVALSEGEQPGEDVPEQSEADDDDEDDEDEDDDEDDEEAGEQPQETVLSDKSSSPPAFPGGFL